MKRGILYIALATAVMPPLFAEETNVVNAPPPKPPKAEESRDSRTGSKEERNALRSRQLRLMERALDEIGVTKEQRQQIMVLQEDHMKKMKANWKRMNTARKELSRLQDIGAPMEELDAAIKEVSDAQTEQLYILVQNRKEMENILGKEKNDLFMEKAQEYFRQHGRRPGAGMPPRPTPPPVPGREQEINQGPPLPTQDSPTNSGAPPLP